MISSTEQLAARFLPLGRQVWHRCQLLAACTDEPGAITRTFVGKAMRQAHEMVTSWMQVAGLSCRVDEAGNLIGRRSAMRSDAPILLLGSHLDTVPNGGKYDGPMGVLAGIACAQTLGDVALPFHLDIIGFSEEEGVRFRLPYLGSHAIAGRFDPAWLTRMDDLNITMQQAMQDFGLNPCAISQAAYDSVSLLGYVEMHIEQGIVLERESLAVGVVSAIAGQSRLRLTFTGEARHAGTTPMNLRADALVAAAKLIIAASDCGRRGQDLRVTVGQIINKPNATNVVPASTQISLDIRHPVDAVRIGAVNDLIAAARCISEAEHVRVELTHDLSQAGVPMDRSLCTELIAATADIGVPTTSLLSGAGHDAVALAAACPVAMLFVRNPGGISHHPDEFVHADDIAVAIQVMTRFIERLAVKVRAEESTT